MSNSNKKPLKVIIQIPCFNEEEALPITLKELPKTIKGVDVVEWMIIDDGSTDNTVEVAKAHGVHHVTSNPVNMGLAKTFMRGIETCLNHGADIIVNTDADNQYNAGDIPALIQPIIEGKAEIVVGARPIESIEHFSWPKKMLQKLGSWMVRVLSNTNVQDAPSGFRAFSAEAAVQLNVFNAYTYTMETIIQAGHKGLRIVSVPVGVNADLRESRLVKSIWNYVQRSAFIMFRIFMIYSPLKFFFWLGAVPFTVGFLLGVRWLTLTYMFPDPERTYLPSLILAAVLLLMGVQTWIFALVADLLAANRSILEEIRTRLRTQAIQNKD